MWPQTRLSELLGIACPIVQAPMAGFSTPALAAAVSNAGGLGSLGSAMLGPEQLRAGLRDLRAATNRPVNANFFVHPRAGRRAARGSGDFMPLYGGQGAPLARELPAAELLETLIAETEQAVAHHR